MSLVFSEFLDFKTITNLQIYGSLNCQWDGTYVRRAKLFPPEGDGTQVRRANFSTPNGKGSGLSIKGLGRKSEDIFKGHGGGLVYILTSNHYPILYVGITNDGLFANRGRLYHHIIKVLAIDNGGTDHTKGWHFHARQRYGDLVRMTTSGVFDAAKVVGDLFVSIASSESNPADHEGYVLCSMFCEMRHNISSSNPIIVFNTAGMNYEPIDIKPPPNMRNVWT
jgi:hypothetical protein